MIKKILIYCLFICFSTCTIQEKQTKSKMKILFVLERFPWFTKTIILNQMIGLLNFGHEVYVYAEEGMDPKKASNIINTYDIYNRMYYQKLPPNLESFNIIICQYGMLAKSWIQLKKTHNLKAKFIVFFRGGDVSTDRHVKRYEYDEVFDQADLLLPICDYFKYLLIRMGADSKKIFVQYSGVNCERFTAKKKSFESSDCLHIISVNRLAEEKATLDVLKALKVLIDDGENVHYTIVGEGPDRKKIETYIKQHDLDDHVDLIGWANHDALTKLLQTADVFVLPSVVPRRGSAEAIPNAIKEAMLMGLPVIATYHGGNAELISHKINGLLVPERDVDSLVDAFSYLIQNPSCWASLVEKAQKKVKAMFCMHKLNNLLEKRCYNVLGW